MSYKAGFCYLVSIVALCASVVFWIKGMSASSEAMPQFRELSVVFSAGNYYVAASALIFSFFAFIGARIVHYCDESLALKEQANEILRSGIRSMNTAKKTCPKCGKTIAADAITCPMCGQ